MARLSDILNGKRARRPVEFPLPNTRCTLLAPLAELEDQRKKDSAPEVSKILVDLVVLTAAEEQQAHTNAHADAKAAGVAEPAPGQPIYDLALMINTLLYGCVDHDSADEVRFFESADQIKQRLDRNRIVYLFKLHELWQDEVSPEAAKLDMPEMLAWVAGVANSDDPNLFFMRLRPGTLWSSTRFLAKAYLSSLEHKSQPSVTSEGNGESTLPKVSSN